MHPTFKAYPPPPKQKIIEIIKIYKVVLDFPLICVINIKQKNIIYYNNFFFFTQTLTVEWDHIPEGQEALCRFMEESGFIKIGKFDFLWSRDVIFRKC
jgi:hypothetical protein